MDFYKLWYQIDIIIYTGFAFYYKESANFILILFLVRLFFIQLSPSETYLQPPSETFTEEIYEKKYPLKYKAKGDIPVNATCSICVEDFNGKGMYRTLNCKHEFHPECIDPWILKCKSNCPLCRKDI